MYGSALSASGGLLSGPAALPDFSFIIFVIISSLGTDHKKSKGGGEFLPCLLCMFYFTPQELVWIFFVVYMLSLFYIATFYRKVVKCCGFLGIKNLQV